MITDLGKDACKSYNNVVIVTLLKLRRKRKSASNALYIIQQGQWTMLILTRRSGQMLTIHPHATLDPATTIGELFRAGPIEVLVSRIDGDKVRIGINAHPELLITRCERESDEA